MLEALLLTKGSNHGQEESRSEIIVAKEIFVPDHGAEEIGQAQIAPEVWG
jgi:hypothetical protein